jgi:hypothetical protein
LEGHHSRSATDCRSLDAGTIGTPDEVTTPKLTAWIEKAATTASNRIAGVGLNTFESVAEAASEPQILFDIRSAKGLRKKVLQFEQAKDIFLRTEAVPAPLIGM